MSIRRNDFYGDSVEVVNDPTDSFGDYLERRILIAMLHNDEFLMNMHSSYSMKFCVNAFTEGIPANLAKACLNFYGHHRKAPNTELDREIIYSRVTQRMANEDDKDLAAGIMRSMIEQYEQSREEFTVSKNISVLWEQAKKFIKYRTYEHCIDGLKAAQQIDDIDARIEAYDETFSHIGQSRAIAENIIEPVKEADGLIERAFAKQAKPLFRMPGAIGDFMNPQLRTSNFISLLAPEKRGKTWWLMEIFYRAIKQGVDAVFVQAGDMTNEQLFMRLLMRIARRSNREKFCDELLIPVVDCYWNQCDKCEKSKRTGIVGVREMCAVENSKSKNGKKQQSKPQKEKSPLELYENNPDYHPCNECQRNGSPDFRGAVWWSLRGPVEPLEREEAKTLFTEFSSKLKSRFKFIQAAAQTLTVDDLKTRLDIIYEQDGIAPQLCVLDYADLLASPANGPKDFRHIQDYNWKGLRGLSQERDMLLVTATQSDAGGYDTDCLNMSNISEDKRKLGHVTAMYGLNQTWDEKRKGIVRINQIVNRDDDYDIRQSVTVLQSFQSGQPLLASFHTK